MNSNCFSLILFTSAVLTTACNGEIDSKKSTEISNDVDSNLVVENDTIKKFASEPGLFKMIRENYLDIMKTDHSYLVITLVSGCNCNFVSFETIDTNYRAFRAGDEAPGYWILKGESEEYSKKIVKYYPNDVELNKPKRNFEEYGLFQSATLIFEIRDNSEMVRWISFDY